MYWQVSKKILWNTFLPNHEHKWCGKKKKSKIDYDSDKNILG